jgi:hypothetical protein
VETRREFPIKITSWHTYDGEEVTGAQVVGEGSGPANLPAPRVFHMCSRVSV